MQKIVILQVWEDGFYAVATSSLGQKGLKEKASRTEGEGFENMGEAGVENLAGQAVAPFHKSFVKRYQQWKRADLLVVALETMPKQVNQGKVLDNLIRLMADRAHELNLSEET